MRPLPSFLIIAVLVWMAGGIASAQVDHGEFRFRLFPFADEVTLHAIQPAPPTPFYQLTAVWDGSGVYTLQGPSGVAWQIGDRIIIDLDVINDTVFFSGNAQGRLRAFIDSTTLTGGFAFEFQGPNPTFLGSGVFVPLPDDPLAPSSSDPMAPLAGE